MAKKPRPRALGKVRGNRFYPWEGAARGRKGGHARQLLPGAKEQVQRAAAAGREAIARLRDERKAAGIHRRVVFHISLTGDYPERLIAWAGARDGNCSAVVREALDHLWGRESPA